jgi:hypothetical protein
MNQLLAYQIGGVFLLAAMLMFGSSHGLIPRSLRNAGTTMCVGVALFGFLIWHFWPDLYAKARSIGALAPSLTTSRPAPAPASRPKRSAAPHASATKQPETKWKTIIVDDSVPAATGPVPTPSSGTGADTASKPAAESSSSSPGSSTNDSGAKRAIKSVGHFLHIGPKKKPANAER